MIDFKKLKLACELCQNLDSYFFTINFCTKTTEFQIEIYLEDTGGLCKPLYSLGELIEELQRLQPKPKPKYTIGDEVWVRSDRDCIAATISDVRPMKGTFEYVLDFHCDIPADMPPQVEWEDDLFPTRDGLIDDQIAYWSSLKKPEKSTGSEDVSMECEHEYTLLSGFRCVKCEKNAISENMNGDCMGVTNEAITPAIKSYAEHLKDKQLAEKCGMDVKEICKHESDGMDYVPGLYEKVLASSELTPTDLIRFNKCKKCGELYR